MNWIDVKERLPKEGEQVLVIRTDLPEYLGYKIDYIIEFPNADPAYIWARTLEDEWDKVTHWMPLPDYPKEG